jgi:hypothetical protein
MAGTPLTTALRRRLYSFARPLASLFSDSCQATMEMSAFGEQ